MSYCLSFFFFCLQVYFVINDFFFPRPQATLGFKLRASHFLGRPCAQFLKTFETGSHCVTQTGLKLKILIPQLPEFLGVAYAITPRLGLLSASALTEKESSSLRS
jgi:hypothetical protein